MTGFDALITEEWSPLMRAPKPSWNCSFLILAKIWLKLWLNFLFFRFNKVPSTEIHSLLSNLFANTEIRPSVAHFSAYTDTWDFSWAQVNVRVCAPSVMVDFTETDLHSRRVSVYVHSMQQRWTAKEWSVFIVECCILKSNPPTTSNRSEGDK